MNSSDTPRPRALISPRLVRESFVTVIGCLLLSCAVLHADQELEGRASWDPADWNKVETMVKQWLSDVALDKEAEGKVAKLWDQPADDGPAVLEQTIATFEIAHPQSAELIRFCRLPAAAIKLPDFVWLESENDSKFVRDNMRLFLGKWFAINEMYNESLDMLAPLGVDDVVDPASLLFYRSAAHYRLREKQAGLETLQRLLENKDDLPRRFATLADLMYVDLKAMEVDSLDEIARIMDAVHVRLGLGRAGTRVRAEEDEIIKKLEKLIEEKEKQQQQQQMSQAQGAPNGNRSQSPAADSMLPGGQSSGEVDPKKLGQDTDWGNLPPKEREEALQSLGKDFPSHYREVIEEYFRKLAREEIQSE